MNETEENEREMASGTEMVMVFTNTNMGTCIAMAVSPHITAADFKREVERKHLCFFPKLGEIEALGLMVRRKQKFYHLTQSLPIKYAFQGLKGTWFLHVEIQPSYSSEKRGLNVSDSVVTEIKRDMRNGDSSELNSVSRCCEASSVSPECCQLDKSLKGKWDHSCLNNQILSSSPLSTLFPNESPGNKLQRSADVGRRMLTAANNMRDLGKKKSPLISCFHRFRVEANLSRISAFEISDSEDSLV